MFIQLYIAKVPIGSGSGSGENYPYPTKKVRMRIRIRNPELSCPLLAGRGPGPRGEAAGQLQRGHVGQALGLPDLRVS